MKKDIVLAVVMFVQIVSSFEFPKLFGVIKPPAPKNEYVLLEQKKALLNAISFTANGKEASIEKQKEVLKIVRAIEIANPPSPILLSDTSVAKELLDGVWYLQYTSPSSVGDIDETPNNWRPLDPSEGESKIETVRFNAQGSISAGGIRVETSKRVVQQIIDTDAKRIQNVILLDWGTIRVSGSFRQSPRVPSRAIVAFDNAEFIVGEKGPTVNLGFVFTVLAKIRGTEDNGWLETTFVDNNIRIGRGNKGTLFILTRDAKDVEW